MKIKKIQLRDYGPIKEFSLEPRNFNIIFGNNESGKTTLVEALAYVLFKIFSVRYGKPENIHIEIEDKGKIINLPSSKAVSILPRQEIANLLYISASDSTIYEGKDNRSRFWDSLKLSLSQTAHQIPFARLITKIREGIGYQPRKNEWKSEKNRVIENDRMRLQQMENFIKEIGETESKKRELKKLAEQYERMFRESKAMEDFKKFKIYQELKNLYNDYVDKKDSLIFYQRYSEDDLNKWQELEKMKKDEVDRMEEKSALERDIVNHNKELAEIEKKLALIERHNLKTFVYQPRGTEKEPNFFYPILISLIGFILLILSFQFCFSILISLVTFLLSIIAFTVVAYKKAKIMRMIFKQQDLLNKAQCLLTLPELKSLEELANKIKSFEEEKIKIQTLIGTKKTRLETHHTEIAIEKIDKELEELRKKTGCAEVIQLKGKVDEKREFQKNIDGLSVKIFNHLGEKDEAKWKRLIDERKISSPLKEYDITLIDEISAQVKDIERQITKLQNEIKFFDDFKKRQYNIANEKSALREIAELNNRIKNYSLELEAMKRAEAILNQLSNELDTFIQNLIQGADSLSNYFNFVTQKYISVKVQNQNFIVKDIEGEEFSADLLSSGAKDQLLLCFRFSALKKLFPEGTFLILDDAFIFADWNRRCRLAELLKKFVGEGNQVFYFTSDEHSRDLLAQYDTRIITL